MAEERKYRIRVDGILVDVSKEVYGASGTDTYTAAKRCSGGSGNPGKAKHGKEPANPIVAGTHAPQMKVYHERKGGGSNKESRS